MAANSAAFYHALGGFLQSLTPHGAATSGLFGVVSEAPAVLDIAG